MRSLINKHYLDNPNFHFGKKELWATMSLFLLLWVILFIRGMFMPMMHDESATFFYYVQTGVVLPPDAHYDANNHFLNSLLAHWSFKLFGASPLAIRLPSILSFALYFYGVKGISGRIKNEFIRWGLLLTLLTGVFIFEYFAECRGYAMALALLVAAVYHYIRLTENQGIFHLILCGIFLWLSTFANLTGLLSSVMLFGLMAIHNILVHKKDVRMLLAKFGCLFFLGLPFITLAKWSFKLKELGLLYYGSLDGFYVVTLKSLSERFLGFYHPVVAVVAVILFGFILTAVLYKFLKQKKIILLLNGKQILALLLIGSLIMIQFLALYMEVNYPEDRAGIYLFIYFFGALAFFLDDLTARKKVFQLSALIFAFFPIYFISQFSIRQTTFVTDERSSQPLYDMVDNLHNDFRFPLTVGGYITQELNWYRMSNMSDSNLGRLHWTNHVGLDADIQLVSDSRLDENPRLTEFYEALYYDPAAELSLFKRKKYLNRKLISTYSLGYPENMDHEYYTLFETDADSLIGKTLFIGIEGRLWSSSKPFISRFVAAVDKTSTGENLAYEYIQLDWMQYEWEDIPDNLSTGTLVHNVPEGAEKVTFYLWNQYRSEFNLRDGKCYLYEVERDY